MVVMFLSIYYGGGGAFFIYSEFFGDDLHIQIIASISPKASVENSSAHWAIFFLILTLIILL